MKIAIIGAGISGAYLYRKISHLPLEIDIFEKSRGVGGRMSTKKAEGFSFDHGAPFFKINDQELIQELQGLSSPIAFDATKNLFFATPQMNSLPKTLFNGKQIIFQHEISKLELTSDRRWVLHEKTRGPLNSKYDWVICTAPARQTQSIFPDTFAQHNVLQRVQMQGCFAVLLGFNKPAASKIFFKTPGNSIISLIMSNEEKPGRQGPGTSLVIQSTQEWANKNIENPLEEIEQSLLSEAQKLLELDLSEANYKHIHRWRYAQTLDPAGFNYLADSAQHLMACGDWCLGGGVESALQSAKSCAAFLAEQVKAHPS